MKVLTWVMVNGATLVGLVQAIIKAIKEVITGVVNLMSLFMPQEKAQKIVMAVRSVLNKIDDVLEIAKGYLIK